ncbi:REP-associated tyrosine transposase [Stenotrophomonas nitritireducens]|uniref:REP-associated tyrosine transposase n=1 Tax=Stenotrophomonas nitritireducens TaxID=83617 RepID=UPI0023540C1C|nr:transposase [Stenotrophomonas nitritireducens]
MLQDMPTSPTPPGHHALRKGRHDRSGGLYLLTTTTHERRPLFAHWLCARVAAASLARPESWPGAALLCWVLMPDHWHGLVRLQDNGNLGAAMRHAKGHSARAVNLALERSGPVWSRAFHDHALRADEDVLRCARYVIANPLRAGLVERIGDYPYWDAVWLEHAAIL